MAGTIRLGRIAGLPIAAHWSALVMVGLLTWTLAGGVLPEVAPGYATPTYGVAALVAAAAFFGSLLAHEVAHATAARRTGLEVRGLTLWLFGGIARLGSEPTTPQADLRIAVVGPLTSLGLSAAFGMVTIALDLAAAPDLVVAVCGWLTTINLLLGLFNLIPGAPLDGGRILRALLWRHHGDRTRAALSAARTGQAIGYGLAGLGLVELLFVSGIGGLWLMFVAWFVLAASEAERTDVVVRHVLRDVRVGEVMSTQPRVVPGWISVDQLLERHLREHVHSVYPVGSADGQLQGLVTLRRLRQLPARQRATTQIADLAAPLVEVATATPDESLISALDRPDGTSRGGTILVVGHDQLVGIVTPTDVARAVDVRARHVPGRWVRSSVGVGTNGPGGAERRRGP